MNDRERIACVEAAVEAHDADHERRNLPWGGTTQLLPVVDLPLEAVLLNPRSHRIQAQLESHPHRELVTGDPWSADAQEVIATILRQLGDNFDDLKRNLEEDGQQDPGVVSRFGLLVNANRRAVALRDLGKTTVRAIVLPPDATDEELDDLELRLQMQRDFKETYTFTNRLLFVDDLITRQSRSINDVARALNLAASSDPGALARGVANVERDTRVLDMLRQVQARSRGMVPLTSFDDQEIALEELDGRLQEMQQQDPVGAGELYEIRLLGLLTDVPYRDLRQLDGEALDNHVLPILEDNDVLADIVAHLTTADDETDPVDDPEGLDLLEDEPFAAAIDRAMKITALNNLLARSHGREDILVPGTDGVRRVDRGPVVDAVHGSLRAAAQEVRETDRHENQLQAPINRLNEAERKVQVAADSFAAVAGRADFDHAAFTAALDRVQSRLTDAADAAGHTLGP